MKLLLLTTGATLAAAFVELNSPNILLAVVVVVVVIVELETADVAEEKLNIAFVGLPNVEMLLLAILLLILPVVGVTLVVVLPKPNIGLAFV